MIQRSPWPRWYLASMAALWSIPLVSSSEAVEFPRFESQTIDDQVAIGYGTAIGDVDGDGKPDILLADKKQFVWYRNPDWKRIVLTENLTEHDNVCIAARDLDGDGRVEIAVGAEWNPGDTVESGSVHYLIPPDDRTQPWAPVKLPHEPVVHRMRWLSLEPGKSVLVVAPLHGRGNQGGKGAGVKLLAYEVPSDPREDWMTILLDDTMHVTHNFDPAQWDRNTGAEEILYLGREGAMLISQVGNGWQKKKLQGVAGGGEIRMGRHSPTQPYLVTIEPFHGSELVYYDPGYDRIDESPDVTNLRHRIVIDNGLKSGHAIGTGDLVQNGSDQIVAGWRDRNDEGDFGIKMYYPVNGDRSKWQGQWIDRGGMACEDLRIGDLNADGRLDVVASGRSTHNLKIYWNHEP